MTTSVDGGGRAASIRDVARVAGVSYQTVSRVLNNHPSIRDTTKERVLVAMQELHYRPNRAARVLVTSRSRTIGILAASSGSYYGPDSSVHAIRDAARSAGYFVTTADLDGSDPASIRAAIEHLLAQAVEGVVIVAPQGRVFDAIAEQSIGVPVVTMQGGVDASGHGLWVDQIEGARLATRHLVQLGHRVIAHLAGPADWTEAAARVRGFHDELAAAGLGLTDPIAGDWTADSGYRAADAIRWIPGVTAVFSSNDQMALGLIHALLEAGVDVPGELSVVGFDDIPEARHFWPPLTTVRQDFAELGRRCVHVLLQEIEGADARGATAERHTVEPELIVRASTAPPA